MPLTREQIEEMDSLTGLSDSQSRLAELRSLRGNYIEPSITKRERRGAGDFAIGEEQSAKLRSQILKFTGGEKIATGLGQMFAQGGTSKRLGESQEEQRQTQQRLIEAIKSGKEKGEDVSGLEKALDELSIDMSVSARGVERTLNPAQLTGKQLAGDALQLATTVAGGKIAGKLGGAWAASAKGIGQGILRGGLAGMASGATIGGLEGVAQGLKNDGETSDVLRSGAVGAGIGALSGGVLGATFGGITGGLNARNARREEALRLLSKPRPTRIEAVNSNLVIDNTTQNFKEMLADPDIASAAFSDIDKGILKDSYAQSLTRDIAENLDRNTPGLGDEFINRAIGLDSVDDVASVARDVVEESQSLPSNQVLKYTFEDTGELIKDKTAKTAIDRGINDFDVNLMKNASNEDKKVFREMYKIMEEASTKPGATNLPVDRAGKTIVDQVKYIKQQQKVAGEKLNQVANNFSDDVVDVTSNLDEFYKRLDDAGVKINGKTLDVSNSRLAGTTASQKKLQKIYSLLRPDKAGNIKLSEKQIHTARQAIYDLLEESTNTRTATGTFRRIAEGLRDDLAKILERSSSEYANINRTYAQTSSILEDFQRLVGKDFNLQSDLLDKRAGEIAYRALGNSSARPLTMLKKLEDTAILNGYKTDQSIIHQLRFADFLEDLFGTTQTRSLRGQVARAGADTAELVAEGVGAAARQDAGFVKKLVTKKLFNITPESQQEIVRKLIGL